MATSQNGWPVLDRAQCRRVQVPGSQVVLWLADDDAVAVIAQAVAAWVDERVEDIDTRAGVRGFDVPDDWSYAHRNVRGGISISNHASGTAWDINAVQHPMGVHGTWSSAQKASVDGLLRRLGGTVRWGEHYVSRVDGMHFEINTTTRADLRAAAVQARLILAELFPPAKPKPTPQPVPTPRPSPAPPTIQEATMLSPLVRQPNQPAVSLITPAGLAPVSKAQAVRHGVDLRPYPEGDVLVLDASSPVWQLPRLGEHLAKDGTAPSSGQ